MWAGRGGCPIDTRFLTISSLGQRADLSIIMIVGNL
jgi:hypothetical protein